MRVSALAAAPLLLGAGVATDILRANNANILLQAATNAAAFGDKAGQLTQLRLTK